MIIRFLHYSGAPKMFLWVANALSSHGHNVTIYTWEQYNDVKLPSNVKILAEDLSRKTILCKIKRIHNVIQQLQPDVSISFLLDSNIFNIIACIGSITKSVVCERNDPFKPKYYKLKLLKPIFRFADGAVFQMQRVADYYCNIKAPTAVIPNPVMNNGRSWIVESHSKREYVISTLGRLDIVQKRTDLLIHAFSIFHQNYPNYKLRLFGDGPDKEVLQEMVNKLKLNDFVEFAGKTSNPLESIKTSKFFVLSSDFEGIPNALIEAMSIGLPCISTDCRPGGAALLIKDGINGLLIPPSDVHILANAMKRIADDPSWADTLGHEAANICYEYSESKISNMWNRYLTDLLSK